jgi:AcrR family transcriptional regulator
VTRRAGRPAPGGRDTRADILDAARALFADVGFERATMRAVATKAGVDVALIYHHYGSKDALLEAALSVPEAAGPALQPIPASTVDPGREVAAAVLGMWEEHPEIRERALAMMRTALSHEVPAQRMRDLHTTAVLGLVSEIVVDDHRELRAALIGAHLSGLLLTRYLFGVPALTSVEVAALAEAAGPAIEHYLAGDLRGPGVVRRQPGRRPGHRPAP